MFARLSRVASTWLEGWPEEDEECLADNLEEILTLDVDLPELSLPSTESAVNAATKVYGDVLRPLYCYVRDTIAEDVESITQALQEANPNHATASDGGDSSIVEGNDSAGPFIELVDHRHSTSQCKSNQDLGFPEPVSLETPGAGPSRLAATPTAASSPKTTIPSIIITPAPPQEREKSSWVPIQDDCYGSRLTVPTHRALNAIHPPMIPTGIPSTSSVHHWTYERGHWWAAALDIEEQEKREIFSRPRGMRRRYGHPNRCGGSKEAISNRRTLTPRRHS